MVKIVNFAFNRGNVLRKAKEYNSHGISTSISYLPVKKTAQKDIAKETLEYMEVIDKIKERGLDSDVTIKLNQFGVYGDKKIMREEVERLVKYAKERGVRVWIDMEMPETVDATIRLYLSLKKKYNNLGICLQAYLKSAEKNVDKLLKQKATIRLVKGFYNGCEFDSWEEVTENYRRLMRKILIKSPKPCIAGHDLSVMEEALWIIRQEKIKNAEMQFFAGVRDKEAREIAKSGIKVRIYIPYGNLWGYIKSGWRTFGLSRHIQRILRFKRIR